MARISDKRMADIYRALIENTVNDVGLQFNLDKEYKTLASMRNALYRIRAKVEDNIERFGITPQEVAILAERMKLRSAGTPDNNDKTKIRESLAVERKKLQEQGADKAFMLDSLSNKMIELAHQKADRLLQNDAELKNLSIQQLMLAMGVSIDKARLLKGEATEQIAILAKLPEDLTHEQTLEIMQKMRESYIEEKKSA